jgi:hypothetical protein
MSSNARLCLTEMPWMAAIFSIIGTADSTISDPFMKLICRERN